MEVFKKCSDFIEVAASIQSITFIFRAKRSLRVCTLERIPLGIIPCELLGLFAYENECLLQEVRAVMCKLNPV